MTTLPASRGPLTPMFPEHRSLRLPSWLILTYRNRKPMHHVKVGKHRMGVLVYITLISIL